MNILSHLHGNAIIIPLKIVLLVSAAGCVGQQDDGKVFLAIDKKALPRVAAVAKAAYGKEAACLPVRFVHHQVTKAAPLAVMGV